MDEHDKNVDSSTPEGEVAPEPDAAPQDALVEDDTPDVPSSVEDAVEEGTEAPADIFDETPAETEAAGEDLITIDEELVEDSEAADLEPLEDTIRAAEAAEDAPTSKPTGIADLVIVGIIALIVGVILALPTFLSSSAVESDHDLSGGVAATVNGVAIGENEITQYVQDYRAHYDLVEDDAWGTWLATYGYDPKTIREETINNFVEHELVTQEVKAQGIEVTDEELDAAIAQVADEYGGQEGLETALASEGMTMEDYLENVRFSLQEQAIGKNLLGGSEVSDEQVLELLQMYGMVEEGTDSLEGVDAETVEAARSMLQSTTTYEAFSGWLESARSSSDLQINDMPEGLPYDVDPSQFQPADDADTDGSMIALDDEVVAEDGEAEAEDEDKQ